MRIAFICKRRYTGGKDVITDRYGRLYEIPLQLARHGQTVLGLCLSYRNQPREIRTDRALLGTLMWESDSVGRLAAFGLASYPHRVLVRLQDFDPHILVGASDILHIALAQWLAKRLGIPYAVDLYDNFEGFGQAGIPGMKLALRRAVKHASLTITVSEPLAGFVRDKYAPLGPVACMANSLDKTLFLQMNRFACRTKLKLPPNVRLIGTAGGLRKDRGVSILCEAWRALSTKASDLHLVLAGPLGRGVGLPDDPRVHYLGELPYARTAELFNALDVGVIYLRDTAFGRYCFPQKAYEMLACGLPVVAANVGAMGALLRETPQCLYQVDDAAHLAEQIEAQLAHPVRPDIPIEDWATVVGRIEPRLREIVSRPKHERVVV